MNECFRVCIKSNGYNMYLLCKSFTEAKKIKKETKISIESKVNTEKKWFKVQGE